jgi:hypothetical protein
LQTDQAHTHTHTISVFADGDSEEMTRAEVLEFVVPVERTVSSPNPPRKTPRGESNRGTGRVQGEEERKQTESRSLEDELMDLGDIQSGIDGEGENGYFA